jgi:flagellar basal-body rod modification protein FlgD
MANAATIAAPSGINTVDARLTSSRTRMADNFETFLGILTTQLRNQDPLSPMDGNQFTQQLVQMTGVEQQLLSNELLKSLVSQTARDETLDTAVALIGKVVTADQTSTQLTAAGADWSYELPSKAASAKLEIKDKNGTVVWTGQAASLEAGRHTFHWDGTVGEVRKQLPNGLYSLTVTADDQARDPMKVPVNITGVVSAAELIQGEPWVRIGSVMVRKSAVNSVQQQPAQQQPG